MRIDDAKTKVILTATRITIFLENNQLVQAHGLAQTLIKIMEEVIDFESRAQRKGVEHHKWYQAYKSIVRLQAKVLEGKNLEALEEIKTYFNQGKLNE